jgi:membrane protease YdiL (CAAX protease family)
VLPWVYALVGLQQRFLPQDPEMSRAAMKLVLPALQQQPVFTALAVGLLAGVCEELLYRGPIQTALLRRLPGWFALTVGALLFAGAHMDMHGMLFRTILGFVLGWMVWRGGSIFPAMLMHMVADSTHFGLLAWSVKDGAALETSSQALMTQLTGPWALAAAGVVLAVGCWVFRRGCRRGLTRGR